MTGIPQVVFLKYLVSLGRLQTIPFALPITLLVLAATIRLMIIKSKLNRVPRPDSDGDRSLDRGMELIILQREVLKSERKDIPDLRVQLHHRQRIGLTTKLQFRLLQVITV